MMLYMFGYLMFSAVLHNEVPMSDVGSAIAAAMSKMRFDSKFSMLGRK